MIEDLGRPVSGALGRYTRDLTREARAGRLDPVRCRDDEVARLIDILLRHGKNNAALVGPAGVGKTAIAEGLAQRLAGGDVPVVLRTAKILALDHVAHLAGTSYRGQYEERIRALVAETSADGDALLFSDELHNLIGQGTALGVAMDAANMLKPALVRGDFRVIGATTSEEYERGICNDPALERRFQRVVVRELTAEETMDVLVARQERLERHHNVLITPEALRAAIELTDIHVKDRRRPDRAIDALDEACAHLQATTRYSPEAEAIIMHNRKRSRSRNANSRHEEPVHAAPEPENEESSGDDDSIEQFARNGFAALERFGAELEAMLVGAPQMEQPAPATTATVEPEPVPAAPPARDWPALRLLLERDGVRLGGIDVARVVALATGQTVRWVE